MDTITSIITLPSRTEREIDCVLCGDIILVINGQSYHDGAARSLRIPFSAGDCCDDIIEKQCGSTTHG